MSTHMFAKRLPLRWTTLKGLVTITAFLIAASLIEYLIVLYAVSLGVKEENPLRLSVQVPWTDAVVEVAVSPLFHLVPAAVMIALTFSWLCLIGHVIVEPHETQVKGPKPVKEGLKPSKAVNTAHLWRKAHFVRVTAKNALTVLAVFTVSAITVSLLAYPQLIYLAVSSAYADNPYLLNLVESLTDSLRSLAKSLAPIGWVCSWLNDALLSMAPGFRDFVVGLGGLIKPLIHLDSVGKYLVFQNVAAWASALTALIYRWHVRGSYRYRKVRRG